MIALNTVVHNEAHRIVGLLEHAAIFCDELVVVDQSSTDGTAALARAAGAKVLTDECRGHDEPSRELAAQHTVADWILFLHPDETLNAAAVVALPQIMAEQDAAAFLRIHTINGVEIGPWPDWQIRFYQRGKVRFDPKLHGRIWPDGERVFRDENVAILHDKSQAEQDADNARYEAINRAT